MLTRQELEPYRDFFSTPQVVDSQHEKNVTFKMRPDDVGYLYKGGWVTVDGLVTDKDQTMRQTFYKQPPPPQ